MDGNDFGGGLAALLGQLFGNYHNPASGAESYLNKIPGSISPYMNPYINAGRNALGALQGQYGTLLNNPGDKLASFGSGFQQDPGYQWNLQQGEQAIGNAAAAGGMAGSPMHQQQAAQLASNLANQNYQNYLHNVMGLYGQGLSGEQGINQMGFEGSQDMAQALAQALMNQANLSYSGQANQNQYEGGKWGSILGALGNFF